MALLFSLLFFAFALLKDVTKLVFSFQFKERNSFAFNFMLLSLSVNCLKLISFFNSYILQSSVVTPWEIIKESISKLNKELYTKWGISTPRRFK